MVQTGAVEPPAAIAKRFAGVKMKEIALDASAWRNRDDFYDAILPALGAPAWHGRNLDALNDSISADDILTIRLPLRIWITNSTSAPTALQQYLFKFADLVTGLRNNRACDVYVMLD
jgi:RNAse (barnase) inhibitor barstar